jgi:hypothetical protein
VGYKVSSVAFSAGSPVAAADSTTALTDIMSNADTSKCPDDCFRPVGLALDSKGRLFMSSDATGEIYVLARTSTATATTTSSPSSTPTKSTGVRLGSSDAARWVFGTVVPLLLLWAF